MFASFMSCMAAGGRHASYLRRIGGISWKSSDVHVSVFGSRKLSQLCYCSVQSVLCSGNEGDMGPFPDKLLR